MSDYKVGDHVLLKLSGGRIVEATIKAIVDTTEGVRLQIGSRGALGRTEKKLFESLVGLFRDGGSR
jgi:hypothetical protein